MIKRITLSILKFCRKHFPIFLIFTLVAIVHLYNSRQTFFWHIDEDIVALTVKRILVDHRPQLIGFPIPGGIYPGPAIFYLLSGVYLLADKNPLNLPLISALIAAGMSILIFYVGKTIFEDKKTAVFAAIIFGFSFSSNVYSRLLTGLTFAPIFALITYFILYKILKLKNVPNVVLLGILLALSLQNEGTTISLFILAILLFIIYKVKFTLRQTIVTSLIILLSHLTLLIFELRHNFVLVDKFKGVLGDGSGPLTVKSLFDNLLVFPQSFSRMIFPTGKFDVTEQILPCADNLKLGKDHLFFLTPIIAAIFLVIFLLIPRLKIFPVNPGHKILGLHLSILLTGLTAYSFFRGSYNFEWITLIFFPAFALILGNFLSIISKSAFHRIIVLLFLTVFLTLNLLAILQIKGRFSLDAKVKAVKFALQEINGRPYFMESLGCYGQGYNYLFWFFGYSPEVTINLIIDPVLVRQNSTSLPPTGVVLINKSNSEEEQFYKKYSKYLKEAKMREKFDEIEVLILENK